MTPASNAPGPTPTAAPAFKVALLSPGPISDAGWNAAAYTGLQAIRDQLGAEIAQVETKTPPEFEDGFREYASHGYRLVFGHGFEFQDAAAKVGGEFPETVFITSSGSTVRPNVAPMVFRLEQATYMLGALAGLMAGDGDKAAVIGGVEIPSVASTFLAFTAGVHAVKPDMEVISVYIGSWDDVSAAKEATLAAVRNGARFVLHNADAAGLGVLRAVAEASKPERPLFAFGSNSDQTAIAPSAVLASAVLDIPAAFVAVAREVRDGSFAARVVELGMKDGIVSVTWNPDLAAAIPEAARARIEEIQKEILAGTLTVPVGY